MQELISANFTKFSAVRETLFREKFRILSNHEILTKDLYIYIYIHIFWGEKNKEEMKTKE